MLIYTTSFEIREATLRRVISAAPAPDVTLVTLMCMWVSTRREFGIELYQSQRVIPPLAKDPDICVKLVPLSEKSGLGRFLPDGSMILT